MTTPMALGLGVLAGFWLAMLLGSFDDPACDVCGYPGHLEERGGQWTCAACVRKADVCTEPRTSRGAHAGPDAAAVCRAPQRTHDGKTARHWVARRLTEMR